MADSPQPPEGGCEMLLRKLVEIIEREHLITREDHRQAVKESYQSFEHQLKKQRNLLQILLDQGGTEKTSDRQASEGKDDPYDGFKVTAFGISRDASKDSGRKGRDMARKSQSRNQSSADTIDCIVPSESCRPHPLERDGSIKSNLSTEYDLPPALPQVDKQTCDAPECLDAEATFGARPTRASASSSRSAVSRASRTSTSSTASSSARKKEGVSGRVSASFLHGVMKVLPDSWGVSSHSAQHKEHMSQMDYSAPRFASLTSSSTADSLQSALEAGDDTSRRTSFERHATAQMAGRLRSQTGTSIFGKRQLRPSWYDNHVVTRFTDSRFFATACSIVILLNVLFVGYETDASMRDVLAGEGDRMESEEFRSVHRCFDLLFIFEWILRIYVCRMYFILGPDKHYNLLDSFLVLMSIIEEATSAAGLKSARVIRALRMLKVLRLARMLRFFSDLRMMVASIVQSCSSLTWALLLLLSIMYLFAIVFMHGLLMALKEEEQHSGITDTANAWYSSLSRTMLTLLQAITSGVDWDSIARPLGEVSWVYMGVFAFYMAFVVIGVLNVLTGIFVERAQELSGLDRDLIVQSAMKREKAFLDQMQAIFEEADVDASGSITWDEFKEYLKNEEIRTYLAAQQLDACDAKQLFDLLDVDGTLEVMLPDFIMGLSRLRGTAKGVDLIALLKETREMTKKMSQFMSNAESKLQKIDSRTSYASFSGLGTSTRSTMVLPPASFDSVCIQESAMEHESSVPAADIKGDHAGASSGSDDSSVLQSPTSSGSVDCAREQSDSQRPARRATLDTPPTGRLPGCTGSDDEDAPDLR